MSLRERIQRQPDYIVPLRDRVVVPDHLRVPEWRRRGLALVKERGYVAVTDLTEKVAA